MRSDGSFFSVVASGLAVTSTSSPPSSSSSSSFSASSSAASSCLDDVDAHFGQHRQGVLDLLGGDLLRRHHGVELLIGDVAALLRLLDHLADGGIGQVEQRQQRVRRRLPVLVLLGVFILGLAGLGLHGFLLGERLDGGFLGRADGLWARGRLRSRFGGDFHWFLHWFFGGQGR